MPLANEGFLFWWFSIGVMDLRGILGQAVWFLVLVGGIPGSRHTLYILRSILRRIDCRDIIARCSVETRCH